MVHLVYEDVVINLIDTPGLMSTGDTSDHSIDKQHVNNILRLLSAYDEIHAICIVLKASETRLSESLTYTLTEILRHLDKGACNNVIFIITHAGSVKFEPDETKSIFQRFVQENKLCIPFPPDKQTIYCFENDTVKYLAECKSNVLQNDRNKHRHELDWNDSVESTRKMLHYVCSIKPHSLTRIKKIYSAEQTVHILSKLVLETLMCVSKDVDNFERKKKEAETLKSQITENPANYAPGKLEDISTISETTVRRTPLGYANVVCEGDRCAKHVDGELVYPQICCEKCGALFMYFCSCMQWQGWCKVCGCEKNKHEWRTTKTEIITTHKRATKVTRPKPGEIVDSNIALQEINKAIAVCENRVKKYKAETEQMLRTCAKMNTFMRESALIEHDDKLSESLRKKIEAYEQAMGKCASNTNLMYMRRIQRQYSRFLAEERTSSSLYDLNELIQQLYCTDFPRREMI